MKPKLEYKIHRLHGQYTLMSKEGVVTSMTEKTNTSDEIRGLYNRMHRLNEPVQDGTRLKPKPRINWR
jgi:hypothetical protein